MFQKTILIGNLGQDAEVRYTQDGAPVVNMSVATSATGGSPENRTKYTEWHRIVCFRQLAKMIADGGHYLKSKQVLIEGRLQTRKWTDKNEITRYVTEIVANTIRLLGPAPAGTGSNAQVPMEAYGDQTAAPAKKAEVPASRTLTPAQRQQIIQEAQDDIPF